MKKRLRFKAEIKKEHSLTPEFISRYRLYIAKKIPQNAGQFFYFIEKAFFTLLT